MCGSSRLLRQLDFNMEASEIMNFKYQAKLQHFLDRAQKGPAIWSGFLSWNIIKAIVKAIHPKQILLGQADYDIFKLKFELKMKDNSLWVGYWLEIKVSHAKLNRKPGRPRLNGNILSEVCRLKATDPTLTQEQLALILKISKSSIHNILKKIEVSI